MPESYRKLQVNKLSSDFRDATSIVEAPVRELRPDEVLMRNVWVGINASDINYTAGHYRPGLSPPFDCGFEAVGTVVRCGSKVKHLREGQIVASTSFSAFGDFQIIKANRCAAIPELSSRMIPLMVSGLTASLALEYVGEIKTGETVLVTAAAGGTGSFAVQIAKQKGCHVIGTCSSPAKVDFLKSLGCDRVVNYRQESLQDVLSKEYKRGVDVVYECVGGEMYDTAVANLAVKGRLIVIGMISGYQDQSTWTADSKKPGKASVEAQLLKKSASVRGFFMNHFLEHAPAHLQRLAGMVMAGSIVSAVDSAQFAGLEQIADAIDYMYERKNQGKLVVRLNPDHSRL